MPRVYTYLHAKPEEVEGLLSKGWYKGRVCG